MMAFAAIALLIVIPNVQAQTYNGLENFGLEGPATPDYGFELLYDPAVQADTQCPTAPAPPPYPGTVRNDDCSVNLGHPDPDRTTSWSAVSGLKLYPSAFGNRLANMASFSAWHNVPSGVPAVENARYQFYYRIDVNEDTVADVCIVQDAGMPLLPVAPTGTGGWQQITFSSTDPSLTFRDTDAECSACLSGCTPMTQGDLQTKYPTARITAIYIQLLHQNWAPDPDPGVTTYPPWQLGYPVYLDDVALTMNDGPGVLIDVATGVKVDEEGPTSDTYEVRLSGPPASGETITVIPDEDPGANPDQVTISPPAGGLWFTMADWNVPKTVTVTAKDDPLAETKPHFTTLRHTVSSSNPLSPYNSATVPSFQVEIADNDLAGVNADPDSVALTEADVAATDTFDVKLGSPPQPGETVTVTLTPDAQSTVDTDVSMPGLQATLTFTALDPLNKPVLVAVVDDPDDETNPHTGKISGTVTTNVPGSIYDGATFTDVDVAIDDNDPDVTVSGVTDGDEAGPVAAVFRLTRGPDLANDVTVTYTIDPASTATSGSDFTAPSGTVTILAGSATADVTVAVTNDATDEPTETLILVLDVMTVPYTAGGASATATVNLLDNDDPGVSVTATLAAASESGPTDGQFTMTRTNSDLAIDVDYTLTGTATDVSDYSMGITSPVHFNAGEASKVIAASPVNDATDEPPETIILTIAAASGYALGAPFSATVTIADNDLPMVSVSVPAAAADEAGPVSGTIRITRTGGDTSSGLAVTFAVTGSATAGSDYGAVGTSTTIPSGLLFVDITIAPVNDALVEVAETVTLSVVADAAYTIDASPADAGTVTIADNDYVVTVAATTPSAFEVGPTAGVFTLTRDKTGHAITVNIGVAGTATAGTDYPTPPATVAFAATDLTVTYSPLPTVDAVDEAPETIDLTLASGSGYTIGAAASATVTIADGDPPVALDDDYTAYQECTLAVPVAGVMANDQIPTGLSYTAIPFAGATAQGGTANLATTGAFTYEPAAGFTGTDSFTYRINDGTYNSAPRTVSLSVEVNSIQPASFMVSPAVASPGREVYFLDRTYDAEDGIATWDWEFGDGYVGTGRMATHIYYQPGTYTVRLVVQDGECATAIATKTVTVMIGPPGPVLPPEADEPGDDPEEIAGGDEAAAPVAEVGPPQRVAEGTLVTLYGLASGPGPFTFLWEQVGGIPVTLSNAASDRPSFTAPTLPDGEAVALYFVLDVSQGSLELPAVIAKVTVTTPNRAPVAAASGAEAKPGAVVALDAAASSDPDGDALSYSWVQTKGPAVTITGADAAQASFMMPQVPPGTSFRFVVEVSDGRLSAIAQGEVRALAADAPPAFQATQDPDGATRLTPTTPAGAFIWEFGDGSPSKELDGDGVAVHRYAGPGTYTVRLTVISLEGAQQSVTDDVDVPAIQVPRTRDMDAPAATSQDGWLTLTGGVALIVALLAVLVWLIVAVAQRGRTQPR